LKNDSEVKLQKKQLHHTASGNDTVPISVWYGILVLMSAIALVVVYRVVCAKVVGATSSEGFLVFGIITARRLLVQYMQ